MRAFGAALAGTAETDKAGTGLHPHGLGTSFAVTPQPQLKRTRWEPTCTRTVSGPVSPLRRSGRMLLSLTLCTVGLQEIYTVKGEPNTDGIWICANDTSHELS